MTDRTKAMDNLIAQDADLIDLITDADQAAAEDWLNANNDRFIDALDLAEAFARHRMEERAAVVAWCRNVNIDWCGCADAIEAGDHLK